MWIKFIIQLHIITLGIAKQELMAMLEEEELKDAILLVFANKQDSRGALNSRHVSEPSSTTKLLNLFSLKNNWNNTFNMLWILSYSFIMNTHIELKYIIL